MPSQIHYALVTRLILIAEKTTVYEEFPTPLINRLEKHFVLYSSVLEKWQTDVLEELEEWIKAFSDVQSTNATYVQKCRYVFTVVRSELPVLTLLLCLNDYCALDSRKRMPLWAIRKTWRQPWCFRPPAS